MFWNMCTGWHLLHSSQNHRQSQTSLEEVLIIFSLCRVIKEEKYAARRAILPMLQAEEDERRASLNLFPFHALFIYRTLELVITYPTFFFFAYLDLLKSGRSILKKRRESWRMFPVGKLVKVFTTLGNGCLQQLESFVLMSGKRCW